MRAFGAPQTTRNYTGQRRDDTGLLFYNARYYNSQLGRFISADTITPEPRNPQTLNRYSYVLNNPINHTDPTGHCPAPTVESGSVICVDLFIQAETVGGVGEGDNRGFSSNSLPAESRGYAYIYLDDNNKLLRTETKFNESCTTFGCFGPYNKYNSITAEQDDSGNINVTWSMKNGFSAFLLETADREWKDGHNGFAPELASHLLPDINGEMTLSLNNAGNYEISSLDRDPFPSLEVYQYRKGQDPLTITQRPEAWSPFFGLSPFSPRDRVDKR